MIPENEHVLDLLPAYALDALEDEDALKVDQHLVRCARCRSDLRAYQSLAAELPLALPQAEPPTGLRARLLEQVHRTHPETPRRLSFWRRWFSGRELGFAALALILILAFSNFLLWQQLNRLQSRLPTNKLTLVTLQGTDAAPEASGLLIISADGRRGTLIVDRLAALDDAHQYQLWLIRDGKRTNGGVFSVSQTGFGTMEISAPDSLANYPAFGITIEPYGGSPGPTGEKVLGGEF